MKSLIKFDDLAFILLFFFLIVAVISFSESAESHESEKTVNSVNENSEIFSVVLTSGKELSLDGVIVSYDYFPFGSALELSCDSTLLWNDITSAVQSLYDNGYSVFLII